MGGEPPSALTLARRYRRQAVGHSPDGCTGWLNWIVTLTVSETQTPIGVVQATLPERSQKSADLAWVITPAHQCLGYASEAAAALVGWLTEHGVTGFAANIHPEHEASAAVARRLGLRPTSAVVNGEVRWCS
jgi:RimJ/RimL family protein N-acetyltransferase